ncbi:MAG: fibronectin type III domain-containing protein [bacterium]|nr:fibronectin type III domain-containing protein [bacterium]
MKFWSILGMLAQFLLVPLFLFAHGTNYIEFNPDSAESLKMIDGAVPSQVFYAQNDFLGGVELWVANPGSSGTATFDLLNEQGYILTSKFVTISNIAQTGNGTRLHVDFGSQIAVLADKKYSIRVVSSMPELQLYYSDRVQVVSHNAPFLSEYITGVGKLGSDEQTFSFKHALYETIESSAPIISNVAWTVISPTQMRVDFNANEPVDHKVEYGPSGQGYTQSVNFTGGYTFCAEGVATCKFFVNVVPNTTYQYILSVKDSWGNQSQTNGTFESGQSQTPIPTPSPTGSGSPAPSPTTTPTGTAPPTSSPTPAPMDKIPPLISNLRIVLLTDTSVQIAWTTNEAANSHLLISTPFFITITDTSDPTMELEHLLKINSGLGANVAYVAKITSIDSGSNESQDSINFTTLPPTDINPPSPSQQPSQINQTNQSNQTGQTSQGGQSGQSQSSQVTTSSSGSGGYVQWDKPLSGEPSSGYRVDVFNKEGNLVETITVPNSSFGVKIPDLEDGEYSVIVYANNDGVFEKIDKPVELKVGDNFWQRLLGFWAYFLIVAILGGAFYWFRKRGSSKIPQSPVS